MLIDFKMTPDGDMDLGQQQTDEDGYLLYYEKSAQELPRLTTIPSERTIPVRDIALAYGSDADLQLIKNRVQTENPDWVNYPAVGADLPQFIGEFNTPETAQRMKENIQEALVRNNAFTLDELDVRIVPVAKTQVMIDIRLKRTPRFSRYTIVYDFTIGVLNVYDGEEETT